MKRHSFLFSFFTVLAAAFAGASDVRATPEPGRYVGILQITKTLPPYHSNALSVTTTVKVVAQVTQSDSERSLTILAAVAEPPIAAFDTAKSVIRGSFQPDGSCVIHGPPFGGGPGAPSDYLGLVTENERGFTLRHDNLPLGLEFFVDPHATQAITDFHYRFRRVSQ
jgi:hypothetical protein